jgi:hypothetical protein
MTFCVSESTKNAVPLSAFSSCVKHNFSKWNVIWINSSLAQDVQLSGWDLKRRLSREIRGHTQAPRDGGPADEGRDRVCFLHFNEGGSGRGDTTSRRAFAESVDSPRLFSGEGDENRFILVQPRKIRKARKTLSFILRSREIYASCNNLHSAYLCVLCGSFYRRGRGGTPRKKSGGLRILNPNLSRIGVRLLCARWFVSFVVDKLVAGSLGRASSGDHSSVGVGGMRDLSDDTFQIVGRTGFHLASMSVGTVPHRSWSSGRICCGGSTDPDKYRSYRHDVLGNGKEAG